MERWADISLRHNSCKQITGREALIDGEFSAPPQGPLAESFDAEVTYLRSYVRSQTIMHDIVQDMFLNTKKKDFIINSNANISFCERSFSKKPDRSSLSLLFTH